MPSYPYALTLTNPGFEAGNASGWTNYVGTLPTASASGAHSGTYRGIASANAAHNWWGQTVNLPSDVLPDVDAGMIKVVATAWANGFTDTDAGRLVVECFDENDVWLADSTSGFFDPTSTYLQRAAEIPVPVGTRSIRISTQNVRMAGTELSVYWDDFDLILDTTVEHASFVYVLGDDASGWIDTLRNIGGVTSGLKFHGSTPSICGLQSNINEAYKVFDIPSGAFAEIDAGNATVDFNCWMSGPTAESNPDTGRVYTQWLDGTGAVISAGPETGAGRVTMSENETQFKRTGAVPAGSRQLKVLLSMNEPDAGTHANANLHRFTIIMSAAGILGLTPRRRMSLM